MNDPQFVEAARQLAERVLAHHGGSVGDRIAQMYTYAFGTTPAEKHQEILERSYRKFYSSFVEGDPMHKPLFMLGTHPPDRISITSNSRPIQWLPIR